MPLLGVVPELPYLGQPTLGDLELALGGELIAGSKRRRLHYKTDDAFLVTTGLRRFLRRAFQQRDSTWMRPLFVTHATRDDLLLGFLAHHQKRMTQQASRPISLGKDRALATAQLCPSACHVESTHALPGGHVAACLCATSGRRDPRKG